MPIIWLFVCSQFVSLFVFVYCLFVLFVYFVCFGCFCLCCLFFMFRLFVLFVCLPACPPASLPDLADRFVCWSFSCLYIHVATACELHDKHKCPETDIICFALRADMVVCLFTICFVSFVYCLFVLLVYIVCFVFVCFCVCSLFAQLRF